MGNSIDPLTARALLDDGTDVRIIDVRTAGEFESAHIPGSYNVPLDRLGEHAAELARQVTEPVVLVCASGARATSAERRLAEAGMGNVKVLTGGIAGWEATGGPLRRGKPRWGLERQVRLVAGSIVLASLIAGRRVPPLCFVAAFIGAGLTTSALTNTCGMAMVLSKLPYNRAATCDIDRAVAALVTPTSAKA